MKSLTIVTNNNDFIIVALDVADKQIFETTVTKLSTSIHFFKVGMQLFFSQGPATIDYLQKKDKKVFLDLKLNDIPHTIEKAVESIIALKVDYLTLFCSEQAVAAAAEIVAKKKSAMKLLNVTVLTSDSYASQQQMQDMVFARSKMTLEAGGHGVICSGHETKILRQQLLAQDFIIVNPGIRPEGIAANDQKRVVTPLQALTAGATNIVIGRPIVQAKDPLATSQKIIASLIQ